MPNMPKSAAAPQIPAGFEGPLRGGEMRGRKGKKGGKKKRKKKERNGREKTLTYPGNKCLVTALAASLSHRQSLAILVRFYGSVLYMFVSQTSIVVGTMMRH